jgi:hypothetical protein
VAQWLVERFELTADDARADDNNALRQACYYGQLDVAQWLIVQFGLTEEDLEDYVKEYRSELNFSLGPKFAAMGV